MLRQTPDPKLERALEQGRRVQRAVGDGVRRALLRHKRQGESVAVWRDGRVIIVPADQIRIPDADGAGLFQPLGEHLR